MDHSAVVKQDTQVKYYQIHKIQLTGKRIRKMKDKQILNLPMHRTNAFAVFLIFTFPCMGEGLLHDLKFRRVTQAFDKTIKIKKIKKCEFTFKHLFHTARAVVVSDLHWHSPCDFSGMERGWVSALPCRTCC